MRINHNISALNTNNALKKANTNMEKALERLSTGYRINKAADDAAGMAISTKMKTQIAALDQANRNSADGVSVIQTAEGALNEVHSMLQRMRELSVQGANGTLTTDDRTTLQNEVAQLKEEIDRVSRTTSFNTKSLLDGTVDRKTYTNNKNISILSISDGVSIQDYDITVDAPATRTTLTGTNTVQTGPCPGGTVKINGESVTFAQGTSSDYVFDTLRNLCDTMDLTVSTTTGNDLAVGSTLVLTSNRYGASSDIDMSDSSNDMLAYLGLNGANSTLGAEAKVTKVAGFSDTATVLTDGNIVTITDKAGFAMRLDLKNATAGDEIKITVLDAGPMELQVGAYEEETMTVRIPKVDTTALGIDTVNVKNQHSAERAIDQVDYAIAQVSATRAKLGAYQNRLEHTISNLEEANLNTTEALSRINDTNMASEMTEYTQKNVLLQAATSLLAQANEKPQQILSLLQG